MNRLLGMLVLLALVALAAAAPAVAADPPRTGFEQRNGASWTTHAEELDFLEAVDAGSDRVTVTEIGRTLQDRPLHLVQIGSPAPRAAAAARQQPTSLFICSQHGNEPAGREACLRWLRDLAFTDDAELVKQLSSQTVLFVPSANPDGRAANSRGNSAGVDINRDHINLTTLEAQAIATVVRDWAPDITVDLHEFGPSVPTLYDEDLLYLWPRNLNVDPPVRLAAKNLAVEYVAKGAEANGERAGEYGRYRTMVGDYHVTQTAGDEDEGIARNAFGLRHSGGLLLETRVDGSVFRGVEDLTASTANRRVNTHYQAVADSLRYMRDNGEAVAFINDSAAKRKTEEGAEGSRPVYFDGQDEGGTLAGNDGQEPTKVADPPPCGYELTEEQLDEVRLPMDLHGIKVQPRSDGAFVSMAQPAEPVIPLLLDDRGARNSVSAQPRTEC
jgi:hypothetical protein